MTDARDRSECLDAPAPSKPVGGPHPIRRRQVLTGAVGLGAAALAETACNGTTELAVAPDVGPFRHGVASGDPLADGVILWTRVTLDDEASHAQSVSVVYRVALDEQMQQIVVSGETSTGPEQDFTVKLDIGGLSEHTTYYYDFEAQGEMSPVGRTKTAANEGIFRLQIGVVSCSSYAHGFFNAYRKLAQREDLDLIVHLGDYIYDQAAGDYGHRRTTDPPHAVVTLADYRRRYARYRTDPDLQALHQTHPFVTVWDDHEFANNASLVGASGHQESDGVWNERRLAALRAYYEWMPIRERARAQVWRSFRFGGLLELFMLDTRMWARESVTQTPHSDDYDTLLGVDQEAWLAQQLGSSDATFKLVGQQVLMSRLRGFPNGDGWAHYPHARNRFLNVLSENDVSGVVILTGDVHASLAIDVTPDPFSDQYDTDTGVGSLALEIVVPPVTSPSILSDNLEVLSDNPHLRFGELDSRGYVVLDIRPTQIKASWYFVNTIDERPSSERLGGRVFIGAGQRFAAR